MAELTRFHIHFSNHSDTDPHTGVNTIYVKGDCFDSYQDLLKENTPGPQNKMKFSLAGPKAKLKYNGAPGYVPPVVGVKLAEGEKPAAELHNDTMDLEQLKKFAQEEEIKLGKAKTRDEVLQVIRSAS